MDTIKQFEPIFGEWKVEKLLGKGSFGSVYLIAREEFGTTYYSALKHISLPQDESEVRQLRYEGMDEASLSGYYTEVVKDITAEIRLMNQLRGNTNIVSYEDHKILSKPGNIGYDIFIRMELLTNLNEYLLNKPVGSAVAIKMGMDLCSALELCQQYNVIHRDIKPDNVFISERGHFKLGDFGIARQIERTNTNLSKKGTYSYMAPEVYKGERYNASADIYSLGIVMYRLLNNNRLPFMPQEGLVSPLAEREQAMLRRMKGDLLPLPCNAQNHLGEIILKACAFDPRKRYATPQEMRAELDKVCLDMNLETESIDTRPIRPALHTEEDQTRHLFMPPVSTGESAGELSETNLPRTGSPSVDVAPAAAQNKNQSKKRIALFSSVAGVFTIGVIIALLLIMGNNTNKVSDTAFSPSNDITSKSTPEASPDFSPMPIQPLEYFEMSDDLFDFTVILDGDVLKLPLTLEVFESYGWKAEEDLTGVFIPGQYDNFTFTRNGKQTRVLLANMSNEVRDIFNSTVCGMKNNRNSNDAVIELPKGVTVGVSEKDDIIMAFGTPSYMSEDEGDGKLSITYEKDTYISVHMFLRDYAILDIDIKNAVQIESDATEISAEITDKEKNYKTPTELGSDIRNFNVMIDGDLYHMPAPLSAFLNNGWHIENKTIDFLPARTQYGFGMMSFGGGFSLRKGDKYIKNLAFYNYSEKPLVIENCFVIKLSSSDLTKVEMILPGGIAIGTSENELLTLFGSLLEKHSDETNGRRYSYFAEKNSAVGIWNYRDNEIVFDIGIEGTWRADEFKDKIYSISIMNQD